MSENLKPSALDQSYLDLKQKLVDFGEVIGEGAFERCESGLLSETDAHELQMGTFYLLSGIKELLKDADLIAENVPKTKRQILRLIGHARALVGGALFVAKHLDVTETARKLNRNEHTIHAREGKKKNRDLRLSIARPILEKAAYKPNGKLLNPGKELERINAALALVKGVNDDPLHAPISLKTVDRYAKAVRSKKTE